MSDYLFPTAESAAADKILVAGDFGYWEHTTAGVAFLDAVDTLAADYGIPVLWLPGNHDKTGLALEKYRMDSDEQGFVRCRESVLLIPNGLAWSWDGVSMRSFGGAWSVDKDIRLAMENRKYQQLLIAEEYRASQEGRPARSVKAQDGTLWFPEEEMTDEDMQALLAIDSERKDIVFSHDKPLTSQPSWNRKDFDGCRPNQKRLDWALLAHRPTYWVHGHLHYFYEDHIPLTGTTVIGLEPDRSAAEPGWKQRNTWLILDLKDGQPKLTLGRDAAVTEAPFPKAK